MLVNSSGGGCGRQQHPQEQHHPQHQQQQQLPSQLSPAHRLLLSRPSVSPVGRSQQQLNQPTQFQRGEKSSVSVRLRKKKGENHVRRNAARHSGDFSFFSAAHSTPALRNMEDPAEEKDHNGDWAYITFPNGVPTVHDIQTNNGANPVTAPAPATGPQNGKPVKVVTREVPGVFPLNTERAFQPNVDAAKNGQLRQHRQSGDFSRIEHRSPTQRQLSLEDQVRLYPAQSDYNRRKSTDMTNNNVRRHSRVVLDHSPVNSSRNSSPANSVKNNFRRRSDHNHAASPVQASAACKRASGEFNFVLRQQTQPPPPPPYSPPTSCSTPETSEESGIGSNKPSPTVVRSPELAEVTEEVVRRRRPVGLGRRSATQVTIEQKKKNSYNAALYKSQDNLVKVSKKGNLLLAIIPLFKSKKLK